MRLSWLAISLGLLALAFIGGLASSARIGGPDVLSQTPLRPSACPEPGAKSPSDCARRRDEEAPRELSPTAEPLPFDWGKGEAWRRHLP